jgi:DNA-binding MarR family transcriptional regulator
MGGLVAGGDMRVYTRIMDEVLCLCSNTRRAALALTSLYDEALAPHGLKVTQFSVLHAVKRRKAPNLSAVAEATGLDRSTLGRNLKVLEELGVVALSPGEDGRDRVVVLTPRGEQLLRAATRTWFRLQERLSAALGEDAGRLLDVSRRVSALARDPSHRADALR